MLMDRKVGGGLLCPVFLGGAGSPSNTMSLGPMRTTVGLLSGILIYPTVQPFDHNTPTSQTEQTEQTDRQTDNGPIA